MQRWEKMPMFEPADSQECLDMMKEAYEVSGNLRSGCDDAYGYPCLPFQVSGRVRRKKRGSRKRMEKGAETICMSACSRQSYAGRA